MKIRFAALTALAALSVGTACGAQLLPKDTEVWTPVPPVVAPGAQVGGAPSDALVLFDGTDLSHWVAVKDKAPAGWTSRKPSKSLSPKSRRASQPLASDVAGRPRVLKVKSSGNTVDVEQFSRDIETWDPTALHGVGLNFGKRQTAGGNELFFEDPFPVDGKRGGLQNFGKTLAHSRARLAPGLIHRKL